MIQLTVTDIDVACELCDGEMQSVGFLGSMHSMKCTMCGWQVAQAITHTDSIALRLQEQKSQTAKRRAANEALKNQAAFRVAARTK